MIVDERYQIYINSLNRNNVEYLERLEQYAIQTHVPIIRKDSQSLLKTMMLSKQPKRILEIGAAIGFSALLMAEYDPALEELITIESFEKRILLAKENFANSPHHDKITLLEGDAVNFLPDLKEPFDFIFLDAAKGQYLNFLPDLLRLLKPQGLLVSDNVLQEGDIIESHYIVERRDRTIHKRMRAFLFEITHHEELETSILTIGDGMAVSVKR